MGPVRPCVPTPRFLSDRTADLGIALFGRMGAPNARRGAKRAVLCSIVVLALTTISSSMRSEVGTRIQIAGAWGVDL